MLDRLGEFINSGAFGTVATYLVNMSTEMPFFYSFIIFMGYFIGFMVCGLGVHQMLNLPPYEREMPGQTPTRAGVLRRIFFGSLMLIYPAFMNTMTASVFGRAEAETVEGYTQMAVNNINMDPTVAAMWAIGSFFVLMGYITGLVSLYRFGNLGNGRQDQGFWHCTWMLLAGVALVNLTTLINGFADSAGAGMVLDTGLDI